METTVSNYVAELTLPAALYASPGMRGELPQPENYGVERGYYRVLFEPDHLGTPVLPALH